MQLVDNAAQRRLAIESLLYRWGIGDWGAILVGLGAVLGAAAWVLPAASRGLGDDAWSRPQAWLDVLLPLGLATTIAAVIAYGVCWLFGLLGSWDYLEFRGDEGVLRARKRGYHPYGRTTWEVPLGRIVSLGLMTKPSPTLHVQLQLKVQFDDPKLRELEAEFTVSGIDRREEALDLLLQLGRVCECGWYFAGSDVRTLAAQVRRERDNDLPLEPLPEATGEADYHANRTATGVAAPPPLVAPFRPHYFALAFTWWKLRTWELGTKVELVRPRPPISTYVLTIAIAMLVASLFGFFMVRHLLDKLMPHWASMLLTVGGVGLLTIWWTLFDFAHREVIFEWPTRQLMLVYGSHKTLISFEEIDKLRLSGSIHRTQEGSGKHKRTKTKYGCTLSLVTGDGKQHYLISTEKMTESAEKPIEELAPLAAELSQSLGVDWEWQEYRG